MKRVADLQGEELDYWVAKALGLTVTPPEHGKRLWIERTNEKGEVVTRRLPRYSVWWPCGGPLIDKLNVCVTDYDQSVEGQPWKAYRWLEVGDEGGPLCVDEQYGPTALVAVCRCVVQSVYGVTVE